MSCEILYFRNTFQYTFWPAKILKLLVCYCFRLLPSHCEEMRKIQCFIRVPLSNPIITCLSYKPYFFTIFFEDWQNLQWWLGLVWLWHQKHICGAKPWRREFLHTVRYTSCNCGTRLLLCPCTCGGVRNSL
jgi:hypothetical protein